MRSTPFSDRGRTSGPRLGRRRFLLASASVVTAGLAYGFSETRVLELTRLRYGLGCRLVFLTDQHIHGYGGVEERIVSLVNSERPDVIVLGGDIIDELTADLKPVRKYLSSIRARELYSVLGNHDYWSGRSEELVELLEGLGYEVLVDSVAYSRFVGPIHGINWRDSRVYPRVNAEGGVVVSHDPNAALKVSGRCLMLSGHTHGGLVVLGAVLATNSVFTRGLYTLAGGVTLYVSRGVGQMLPLRPTSPLEVLIVE